MAARLALLRRVCKQSQGLVPRPRAFHTIGCTRGFAAAIPPSEGASAHEQPAAHADRDGGGRTATAPSGNRPGSTTHFGFASVPLAEKQFLVRGVFERVAPSYDCMNDAMSLTVHRAWKRALVATLAPTPGMRVLDCAGGTGDVAFRILSARGRRGDPPGRAQPVVVCDINPEMLAVGKQRAQRAGWTGQDVRFVEGNAENLPFPGESMDAYVISFGMRNVPRPEVALSEAMRVLRPGGRFLMLEFAAVRNPLVSAVYDAYSFYGIPALGKLIANDAESYKYLVESIRQFPKQDEFACMMAQSGLQNIAVSDYSFGIAAEYSGFKSATPSTRSDPVVEGNT
jgi:demethylmenaquinone methyltransferase / 2-methoxy-6-polyprenyl-1,4-benzoquinol methylase